VNCKWAETRKALSTQKREMVLILRDLLGYLINLVWCRTVFLWLKIMTC